MWRVGDRPPLRRKKMSFLPFGLSTVAPADRNVGFGLPWSCKKQLKQGKPASSSDYEMRVRSASSTPPPPPFFFFFYYAKQKTKPLAQRRRSACLPRAERKPLPAGWSLRLRG